jgi:ABC-type branched-subunit amino acid transport system ATPase component
MSEPILSTRGLTKHFGGIYAVRDVDLDVPDGAILGVIGPNGSGKSTLFALLSGLIRADAGTISFGGKRIDRLSPNRIARLGMGRSFQLSRVFRRLTVRENLLAVGTPSGEDKSTASKADELLELVDLTPLRDDPGESLSYGQQRLLELARLSMLSPRLVLLDELFAGVNPTLQLRLGEFVQERHRREGTTFLIVDHNMALIARLCDEVVVMDLGQVIARGTLDEIQHNDQVAESFLGRRKSADG